LNLLLDSCVWGGAMAALQDAGHDVVWCGNWPDDPGDMAILAWANTNERVIVTLDKDFGELAIVRGLPHVGIVRLVGFAARQQAVACRTVLENYGNEIAAGAIVTVDPGRVRVRSPQ
jgi:predicted nuclease of predicted toxin-antitoxin system